MPLTRDDLKIYQGDDYAGTVTVRNDDGTPADLTGYTAQSQIRRAVADSEPVIAVQITTTIDSPNILLAIPKEETEPLSGRYTWDLQLTSSGNAITTIMAGKVIVTPEVTRP